MTKIGYNQVLATVAVVLLSSFIIMMLMIGTGVIPNYFIMTGTTGTPPSTEPTKYTVTCLTKFTIKDEFVGAGVNAPTITIYEATANLVTFDSGTADANGLFTSTRTMKSGDYYWIKLAKTSATYFEKFQVPYEDVDNPTYHYVTTMFYTFPLSSLAISGLFPNGTSMTGPGDHFNATGTTCTNYTMPSFSIQVFNNYTTSDSGYKEYIDPFKTATYGNRETIFYFAVTGASYTKLMVQNMDLIYKTGSANYYGFKIDPWKLVLDKKPTGEYNQHNGEDLDGMYSFKINFDATGFTAMGAGECAYVNCTLMCYTNFKRFCDYGTNFDDAITGNNEFNFAIWG